MDLKECCIATVTLSRNPREEAELKRALKILKNIGTKGDYCYGPFLMTTDSAKVVLDAPDHLGWGWRFFLFGRIHKTGMHIQHVRRSLPCPRSQRRETKPDRIYRLKQLRQNLEGL